MKRLLASVLAVPLIFLARYLGDKYLLNDQHSGLMRSANVFDWICDILIGIAGLFIVGYAFIYIVQLCCNIGASEEEKRMRRIQRYLRKRGYSHNDESECWCESEIEPPRYYESLEGA